MENLQKAIDKAEELGWGVYFKEKENECYICFSNYTSYGQDIEEEFDFDGTLKDLLQQLSCNIDNYDCSYETSLWLDNDGHGKNGASYDMKDVYNDMEERLKMTTELRDTMEKFCKGV